MADDPGATDIPVVIEVRSQTPPSVLALGAGPILLAWRVAAGPGQHQLAYEVEIARDSGFESPTASTGIVSSADQVGIECPGGPSASREVRFVRVRIRSEAGWSTWSHMLRLEVGLLRPEDWVARAVTLPGDPGATEQAPAPMLRGAFAIRDAVTSARLYVTSLGLHEVVLNGAAVADDLLSPGWTPYHRRLLVDTYDVTALLRPGENVLAATIGDGWYRGRVGWEGDHGGRCQYGDRIALLAQLEVAYADGSRQVFATGTGWRASTGEIRRADLYDGTEVDLRETQPGWQEPGFDDQGWAPAEEVELDPATLEPRAAEPVRRVRVWAPRQTSRGSSLLLDGGQNIAGYVRLVVRGMPGQRVVVRHAEVLDPDGSLHTRSLRTARATDEYVLAGVGEATLEPRFTFHGFRWAEVTTDAVVISAEFVAISSALSRRAHFECADPLLNRLHDNVIWSLLDNFVSLPTDCPQRDERLGWTGDAQVFAATASTLFATDAFWDSWLRDLSLEQDPILGVPSIVPDVVLTGAFRYGRAGWSDAVAIVPWAVYESYGEPSILMRYLPAMRQHVESLRARCGEDGLLGAEMQFGDWLDPDAPVARPWEAKTDPVFLANVFFAHSARLTAAAAGIAGDQETATLYGDLGDRVAGDVWRRWGDHALQTQTGCAIAIVYHIAPPEQLTSAGDALARMVRETQGRIATGFLGTPHVLPALTATGHDAEVYQVLLRRTMPSWLYQVEMGATTIWERWDAIRSDGSIHSGEMRSLPDSVGAEGRATHMLSFNHYAYGAVIDWVYRHLVGLSPVAERPGYRHVLIAPMPPSGMSWARASVESAYGPTAVEWSIGDEGELKVTASIPFGAAATFVPPVQAGSVVEVDGMPATGSVTLDSGRHQIRVTNPVLARVAISR